MAEKKYKELEEHIRKLESQLKDSNTRNISHGCSAFYIECKENKHRVLSLYNIIHDSVGKKNRNSKNLRT